MTWALEPIDIKGPRVHLRNFDPADFPAIVKSLDDPEGWFGVHWGYKNAARVQAMLEQLLQKQQKGHHNVMVYTVDGQVAGITRFMRIEPANRALEIGGTWVAPHWQKSFVNTEVKLLLLRHCFEYLQTERVEFRVDDRNIDSQRAVLRLGATFEGRLRSRQLYPDGIARDGILFSIIRREWNSVKDLLQQRLADPQSKKYIVKSFPLYIRTPRLLLRRYEFSDAITLFGLIETNREDLYESFPGPFKEITSRQTSELYIQERLHQWHMNISYYYAITSADSGKHIGQVHVTSMRGDPASVELGYFLCKSHRGQKLGSEMLTAILEFCFSDRKTRRVSLRILPANTLSVALAEKFAFKYEGLHQKEFRTGNGEFVDICYYSKTQR